MNFPIRIMNGTNCTANRLYELFCKITNFVRKWNPLEHALTAESNG